MSVGPKTDLVAEDPRSACPVTADGAFGDDASPLAAQVRDRRLLDDERPLWDSDLERGVVEVAHRAPLHSCHQRLVGATVEPDEVTACAEWQPVQVDCSRPSCRIASEHVSAVLSHTGSIASALSLLSAPLSQLSNAVRNEPHRSVPCAQARRLSFE